MRLRLPLYGRVLVWLLANLAVLVVAFAAVFHFQFRLGLDSLLAGRAGERIQAVGQVLAADLRGRPVSAWNEVLPTYSQAYKADFHLFRIDGTQLAGAPITLPESVLAKFPNARVGGDGRGRGPPPGRGPRRAADDEPLSAQVRFLVRAGDPPRYWAGVELPLGAGATPRDWSTLLILTSGSMSLGGLFVDSGPWVLAAAAAVLFSVLFWLPLVRDLTRTIGRMTRATEALAEGRFDTRVDERRGDELGRLGQAVNRMAARLAGFVHGQKRFLGDIAHELCSPLARMQVALGILEARTDESNRRYVDDVREEVEHMSGLVNELLDFSKAGLRARAVTLGPVEVAAVARRAVARETASGGAVDLQVPADLLVLAEPELLGRALGNLVRNALRYAGAAGPIELSARAEEGRVILCVTDHGPGVAEGCLPQIFDPFFRSEPSRCRESGGTGLGLAIVKSCVEACQGTVVARNRRPAGLEVEITLQAAPRPAPAGA